MDVVLEKYGVSDDSYLFNEAFVQSGDSVTKGQIIFSIETSKVSIEVESPGSGYIYFVDGLSEGDELPVGFLIAKIVDNQVNPFNALEEDFVESQKGIDTKIEDTIVVSDAFITERAKQLMNKYSITQESLPEGKCITEGDILKLLRKRELFGYGFSSTTKKVAIIGGGVAAVQVIDLIRSLKNYVPICIFDDMPEKLNMNIDGVKIIGPVDFEFIKQCYLEGIFDYIINSVGISIPFRKKCFKELKRLGVPYCNLIHESVVIGSNLKMGVGNVIYPQCNIGPDVSIGDDNYISGKVSIEHHNILGSHCTFGPGVLTSGTVTINDECRFGTGIFIEPCVKIGQNVLISSGAIIVAKSVIPDNSIVRHNPSIEIVKKHGY